MNKDSTTDSLVNHRTLRRLVERDVYYCVSTLVAHLAKTPEALTDSGYTWEDDVLPLCIQEDYESAWTESGALVAWDSFGQSFAIPSDEVERVYSEFANLPSTARTEFGNVVAYRDNLLEEVGEWVDLEAEPCTPIASVDDFRALCDAIGLEPQTRESFEFWIVSSFLEAKLRERGEMTGELFGLTLWGRCTTGQAIYLDGVIREIASDMEILAGQRNAWEE